MEFSFFFYSAYSSEALYDGILEYIKDIAVDGYECNEGIISSNPIQVWFFNEDDAYREDYVFGEYGFRNNHDLIFYVYSSKDDKGMEMMFGVVDFILKNYSIENFVLQDPGGFWVMKRVNGVKQLRDTDVFEYPFELLECSGDFERCEADRYY